MCEPRLGIVIQGRMRNLGLSMTRGRFFSRRFGVHPMKGSRVTADAAGGAFSTDES